MGRVKSFDRNAAVQTAMLEMWNNGYEACSVKSLSETLGMTRSSFYNAFGSREELFLEVLDSYFKQSPDRELENINSNNILLSICQVFKNICLIRADDNEHKGCLAVNSVIELVGNDEKVGPILSNAVENSMKRFENLLELAAVNEEFTSEDINSTSIALQNLLIGINVLCKVVHDSETLWQSTKSTLQGLGIYKPSFEL